jgi:hypothetical protein
MVRGLKSRLGLALREMHRTGVVKEEDMPEPEEILALRICSPYAEFNGTIATLLFELGYLHYGGPPQCSHDASDSASVRVHSPSETNDGENPPVVTEDLLLATANTIKRIHNELKQVVASQYEECRTALNEISRRLDETATRAEELHRQHAEAKEAIDRVEVTAKVAKEASAAAAAGVAKGCTAAQELTRRVVGLVSKLEPEPAADADSTAVATPAAADSGSSTIANVNLPGQARGTPAEITRRRAGPPLPYRRRRRFRTSARSTRLRVLRARNRRGPLVLGPGAAPTSQSATRRTLPLALLTGTGLSWITVLWSESLDGTSLGDGMGINGFGPRRLALNWKRPDDRRRLTRLDLPKMLHN